MSEAHSAASYSKKPTSRSQVICSCGAATCYKVSKTDSNPNRRFLCCKQDCGFIRWADSPSSSSPPSIGCVGCEKVIPALLRSMEKKDDSAIKKAKEQKEFIEEVADNELDLVPRVLKEEWFDDYDSVLQVFIAEYEGYTMYPEVDYDPEVLEDAWWDDAHWK